MSKVWVIIAAYNGGEKISDTVVDVLKYLDNVVVVDDCSTDDTFQRRFIQRCMYCAIQLILGKVQH